MKPILDFVLGVGSGILIIVLFSNFVLPHVLIFLWKNSVANKEKQK